MAHAYNFIDLTGQKFNKLTVVEFVRINNKRNAVWRCRCDCGNFVEVAGYCLKNGNTKSCGCLKLEVKNRGKIKHGHLVNGKKSTEYIIRQGFIQRCYDPNNSAYKNYGERGIIVCDRWLGKGGFINFIADMGLRPSLDHSIDRIDNNGPYSPENCRWATDKQQANNTRKNRVITFNGEVRTKAQWQEYLGLSPGGFSYRLKNWDSLEKIITTPRLENRPLKLKSRQVIK